MPQPARRARRSSPLPNAIRRSEQSSLVPEYCAPRLPRSPQRPAESRPTGARHHELEPDQPAGRRYVALKPGRADHSTFSIAFLLPAATRSTPGAKDMRQPPPGLMLREFGTSPSQAR